MDISSAELQKIVFEKLNTENIHIHGVVDAEKTSPLPHNARSVVVFGTDISHDPSLDFWGVRGGTASNHRLIVVSNRLVKALASNGIRARRLRYKVEEGGIFLKDAAASCGIGVIGRNNLLIVPGIGPRIRLMSVAIESHYCDPTMPARDYDPCSSCHAPCLSECPQNVFNSGSYLKSPCRKQMDLDEKHADPLVIYCRKCETSCLVGTDN